MFTFSHGRALRMHSGFFENTQTDVTETVGGFFFS